MLSSAQMTGGLQRLRDNGVSDLPGIDVESARKPGVAPQSFAPAIVRECTDIGQRFALVRA